MTKIQATASGTAPKLPRRTRKPPVESPTPAPKSAKSPKPKAPTKGDLLIKLLRRPEGVTAAQMGEATGWQIHSVRGFIAGSVKKKLGLVVATEKVAGETLYRIVDQAPA